MTTTTDDVLVLGAGAAGLFCAFTAGQRGLRVRVIEHANKVGKKILMSGGGRCNFTNTGTTPANYLSANPHFCKSALARYKPHDFIAMVDKHGIQYHEKELGQLFCDESSKLIVRMLVDECRDAQVAIETDCTISAVKPRNGVFEVITTRGVYTAASIVVATGGLSIPSMGATGFGYQLARQFGHAVLPTRAGLVPLTLSGKPLDDLADLSGLALPVEATAGDARFRGGLLITHRGLSGPAVLQVSNYWQLGESIHIDLMPGEAIEAWLKEQKHLHAKSLLRTLLSERLAKALVLELQTLLWPSWAETPMAAIPDAALTALAQQLQDWTLKPAGTEGYRTAEVTLGGVDTHELSSRTMESKRQAGLYFIGEVVDVTGWLGGYNFQWAWSSGHAAGQFV